VKGLLIDLDGVLYVGTSALPGAQAAIDWLQASGIPHLFLTNTSSRPRSAIVDKLVSLGFRIDEQHILTPPVAAASWLAAEGLNRIGLYVSSATRSEFAAFQQIDAKTEPVDAVIVGDLGEGWHFAVLNRAFQQLMQSPPPRLIALGMTRYWQAPDGLRLDTAPFVMALSHASGVEPVVLGKPSAAFFEAGCTSLGLPKAQVAMIGDDVRIDVEGAVAAGLAGVLVRTGKFRPTDLDGGAASFAVLDSLADLPRWWSDRGARR
jgi:HAD superfamily hydrolase (TIGR01458 family)